MIAALPYVMIKGERLVPEGTRHSEADVAVLDGMNIDWGNSHMTDEPRPSTASMTLLYRGHVDSLTIEQGDPIDIQQWHVDGRRSAFSGRVRSMQAELDKRGRLLLHITASDHLADLSETYVQTAWHSDDVVQAEGRTVLQHLQRAITAAGWEQKGWDTLPAPLGPSAATFYASIKLTTLLSRYLAQFGPQATFWDSSFTTENGLRRRVSVGFTDHTAGGDVLTADSTGTWALRYGTPALNRGLTIPAALVHRDVEWDSSPESLVTAAQLSHQVTRKETREDDTTAYVTSLEERNFSRSTELVARYGRRTVELTTMTRKGTAADIDSSALWRQIADKWMNVDASAWRPGALSIRDTTGLDPQTLSDLIGTETRQRLWITVPGIRVVTPRGEPSSLRGVATGGQLTWDARRQQWRINLTLSDTSHTLDHRWTFSDLSGHPSERFSRAVARDGGAVTFADFATIDSMQET